MKVRPVFAWYDFWIGGFYDQKKKRLYLMIPFVGVYIERNPKESPKEQEFSHYFVLTSKGYEAGCFLCGQPRELHRA